MNIQIIAAKANNNVIGAGPNIPWQAKGEQKLFRDITMGAVLIMGRKTFESIGRPLPGRTTIIVTRNPDYQVENCLIATSLEQAITLATEENKPIFIAGGGDLYAQAMPLAEELHLTTVDVTPEGDVFFPEVDLSKYALISETAFETNLKYTYQHYQRLQQL